MADDIRAASGAGLISAEQAEKLVSFLAERAAAPAPVAQSTAPPAENDPDAESVRFVRGFQDVLLTIGVVLLLIGAGAFSYNQLRPWGGVLWAAALAFALAIAFARNWRLVLPSMALAAGFTIFVGIGVIDGLSAGGFDIAELDAADRTWLVLYGALAALAAAAVFYIAFRLPFALGVFAVSGLATIFAALNVAVGPDRVADIWALVLLGSGVATFLAAMAFDLTDPLRRTLRADNAFWLHLAAAPMIVHAVISLLVSGPRHEFSQSDGLIVVLAVAALAWVAVVVDRRALFVSALGYFGFAIAGLIREAPLDEIGHLAVTLVVTGTVVVVVAVWWHGLRRALLGGLPMRGILGHLPPVRKSPA